MARYPVRVEASLDQPLNRWLWLVKWLLALPHYVVLFFLWLAFGVVSVAAFFAILVSGRYPRALFEFNVGVLRWSWRVGYYSYSALGTDRYPPFTLHDVPDYPTRLDVDYPEHLSRGLALVKWWLLAIPHYLVVSLFVGAAWFVGQAGNDTTDGIIRIGSGGLIGLLVLVAAVVLLFRGHYPQPIFDFVMGMNRWVLRVAAYAALMTDTYPPFRLDQGGQEPAGIVAAGSAPQPVVDASPEQRMSWSAGRLVALVTGCLLTFGSLVTLAGGLGTLWVDQVRRDDSGFVTSPSVALSTPTYAVASSSLELHGVLVSQTLGEVRVRTSPKRPDTALFIGVATTKNAERYLSGVEHETVREFTDGSAGGTVHPGTAPTSRPSGLPIWVAQDSGTGPLQISWPVRDGSWTVVVMNADGSPDVAATADLGATLPVLDNIWIWFLIGGGVLLIAGGGLIIVAVSRAGGRSKP